MRRKTQKGMLSLALLGAGLMGLALSAYAHDEEEPDPAPGSAWEAETCLRRFLCGDAGGYVAMSYNAVGSAMVWTTEHWEIPMIQYKGRHSEFRRDRRLRRGLHRGGDHRLRVLGLADRLTTSGTTSSRAAPSSRRTSSSTGDRSPAATQTGNSHGTKSLTPCMRSSFKHLVYGGYNHAPGPVAVRRQPHPGVHEQGRLADLGLGAPGRVQDA